ncbi:MAG: ABC transporter ATP-binding protein [Candidatus Rokubacteria bacterium 13_2_20CM_2_64_8]|nr:MAG: ABC transporter ATP-binding protein [Candidatus Rokubacteria bacterium 13_2_20CM_2_64_8]
MLAIEDIHTYYGDSYVLQGLSLRVASGTIVALLGRNGMGKPTLIRSVAGLTPPRRGRITFRGSDVVGLPPYRIAQLGIALVPQGRRTFPSLTVRENLQMPQSTLAGLSGRTGPGGRGRAERWSLSEVVREFPQIGDRLGQRARNLSGGEQQMLAIGRALMANPDLILMDEPSEGLAPVIVQQLGAIMRRLRSQGHSILLVEQNVGLAMEVADYVYVIATGRVTCAGTPAELDAQPDLMARHLGIER